MKAFYFFSQCDTKGLATSTNPIVCKAHPDYVKKAVFRLLVRFQLRVYDDRVSSGTSCHAVDI